MGSSALKLSSGKTAATTLTEQLWGIDWRSIFPRFLSESVRVEIRSYQEAAPLIADLFPDVYLVDGQSPFGEKKAEFKQRYYEMTGDFFVFLDSQKGDKVAGMAIGTVLDWSSYNFRNIAIAPEYQESGLYFRFFEILSEILQKHGVARIEGDVAPTNRHHIHVLNKMGYVVTAMSFSERWGVLLHIAKYLDQTEEERFTKLFSMTANSDLKGNQRAHQAKAKARSRGT